MANFKIHQVIDWGVASAKMPGEVVSGDLHVLKLDHNSILIGVIDGAGHGEEAAEAARCANVALEKLIAEPLAVIFQHCHENLRSTRGAAMSIASLNLTQSTLTWAGVGNVEGVLLHKNHDSIFSKETLLLRNGVVGYAFTVPRISKLPVNYGDTLIFTTDGIRSNFLDGIDLDERPQDIANSILVQHAKETDDALALVIRFIGSAA